MNGATMKNLRLLIPGLGLLALVGTGCFITSGQILVFYDLPDPFTINSVTSPFEEVDVDLNEISEYADHKDKVKGVVDLAVLGTFTNVAGGAGAVEVWITPSLTSYTTVGEVTANGTRLWGPASIGAAGSADAVRKISWDDSAALFAAAGKKILIDVSKGAATTEIYTFGTAGTYSIDVDEAGIAITIDAGIIASSANQRAGRPRGAGSTHEKPRP